MTDDARRYHHLGSALTLLRALRRRWQSLAELGVALDLQPRSVRRLIDVLRVQGVVIDQRPRARPGLSPESEYRTRARI